MDTTFKIIVEGVVKEAVLDFNRADDDTPERETARIRLLDLLELNYPMFKGRYKNTGRVDGVWFIAIERETTKKKKEVNIFA
jgi:hypothetical protein